MNQQDFRPQQTRNPAKDGNASTAGFFSGLLEAPLDGWGMGGIWIGAKEMSRVLFLYSSEATMTICYL
jgi:hypothetical protein